MIQDTKTNPQDIVGAYLAACIPPPGASTAQVVEVINAWNAVVQQLKSPGAKAESDSPPTL